MVAQVLQELTRSRQWASVAKHPSMQERALELAQQLQVTGPASLGQLQHLSREKVAHIFSILGLTLESCSQKATVRTEAIPQTVATTNPALACATRVKLPTACSTAAMCLLLLELR